jgi:hypothetical protein
MKKWGPKPEKPGATKATRPWDASLRFSMITIYAETLGGVSRNAHDKALS